MLDSYILERGGEPIGPLVMKTTLEYGDNSKARSVITYLQQANAFYDCVDSKYRMEKSIIIPNCVHEKFSGDVGELILFYFRMTSEIGHEKMSPEKDIYTFLISQNSNDNHVDVEVYIPIRI
jgi:hypothetical protein